MIKVNISVNIYEFLENRQSANQALTTNSSDESDNRDGKVSYKYATNLWHCRLAGRNLLQTHH